MITYYLVRKLDDSDPTVVERRSVQGQERGIEVLRFGGWQLRQGHGRLGLEPLVHQAHGRASGGIRKATQKTHMHHVLHHHLVLGIQLRDQSGIHDFQDVACLVSAPRGVDQHAILRIWILKVRVLAADGLQHQHPKCVQIRLLGGSSNVQHLRRHITQCSSW